MPKSKFRDDVTVIGVPLTQVANATWDDPRQRQLFKNIMYIGALGALLDIDPAVVEALIGEQYRTQPKLLAPNVEALHLGRGWVMEHLSHPIGLRVRKAGSEEHTSELQSLMRISYAVFCLQKTKIMTQLT